MSHVTATSLQPSAWLSHRSEKNQSVKIQKNKPNKVIRKRSPKFKLQFLKKTNVGLNVVWDHFSETNTGSYWLLVVDRVLHSTVQSGLNLQTKCAFKKLTVRLVKERTASVSKESI